MPKARLKLYYAVLGNLSWEMPLRIGVKSTKIATKVDKPQGGSISDSAAMVLFMNGEEAHPKESVNIDRNAETLQRQRTTAKRFV